MNKAIRYAIGRDQAATSAGTHGGYGSGTGGVAASGPGSGGGYNEGNFCFDPGTIIQMAYRSNKESKRGRNRVHDTKGCTTVTKSIPIESMLMRFTITKERVILVQVVTMVKDLMVNLLVVEDSTQAVQDR